MGMFRSPILRWRNIAALRSISNLIIISPADDINPSRRSTRSANRAGSVYLRLTGVMNAIVYKDDYDFQIGKMGVKLREGCRCDYRDRFDGPNLQGGGIARERRHQYRRSTYTPSNRSMSRPSAKHRNHRLVVTVEEHSVMGGLGHFDAEHLAEKRIFRRCYIGGAGYPHVGDYQHMLEVFGSRPQR